jgi:hypothetical protein
MKIEVKLTLILIWLNLNNLGKLYLSCYFKIALFKFFTIFY